MLAATALSLVPLWLSPVEPDHRADQQRAPIAIADLEIAAEPAVPASADPPIAVAAAVRVPASGSSIAAPLPATGANAARQLPVLTTAPKTSPPRDA